ncbi:MAG: DUF4186 family protein [Alphaproteobacteria bacterium]|jgi:hypothetical protein|nr:DUF4186 family protein [Alphaproteobacteria bacterium]
MSDAGDSLIALGRSRFRRRFRLGDAERRYLAERGMDAVMSHGRDFVEARLAPAQPRNDGRQTPMRGHPVFIAQHATATCCRSCLGKWHGIAPGRPLDEGQIEYVLEVIRTWLARQMEAAP